MFVLFTLSQLVAYGTLYPTTESPFCTRTQPNSQIPSFHPHVLDSSQLALPKVLNSLPSYHLIHQLPSNFTSHVVTKNESSIFTGQSTYKGTPDNILLLLIELAFQIQTQLLLDIYQFQFQENDQLLPFDPFHKDNVPVQSDIFNCHQRTTHPFLAVFDCHQATTEFARAVLPYHHTTTPPDQST
jgi:hypothetical protein